MQQDVIADLKRDHLVLFEHMEEARRLGMEGPAARMAMKKARSVLLAHLRREDQHLYPRLEEAAKTDREFAFMFRLMGEQMQEVSRLALDFFDRYEEGKAPGLAREFSSLYSRLQTRMRMEESDLYRYFERLPPHVTP